MKSEHLNLLWKSLILTGGYVLLITCVLFIEHRYNIGVSVYNINSNNLLEKLINDLLLIVFPSALFISIFRKAYPVEKLNRISWILIAVYVLFFFVIRDITIRGLYIPIYFLGIGLSEELIFRKYLYSSLNSLMSSLRAGMISGGIWGLMHVIVPLLNGNYYIQDITIYFREGIRGIILGFFFIFIWKKTKSIWNAILVHALMDYIQFDPLFFVKYVVNMFVY